MELSDIIWEVKRDAIRKMIASGKRSDGRAFDEYRPLELTPDYIPRAEGSCLGRLGNTQVLVGVKFALAEPYPDRPDSGSISVGAELLPLASPSFEAGPPDETSIEVARVVDRGIRESHMIDFDKLCIEPGKLVWNIMIDLHVLDHDGNLIDCGSMTAVKALLTARFPKREGEMVLYGEKTDEPLPIDDVPVSSTFAKIGDVNALDPSLEEEKVLDSRLTLVTNRAGCLCASQKGCAGPYEPSEIEELVDLAIRKGKDMRKFLE